MFIAALFIFISFLLAGMIYLQGNILDGIRSYVRGEGLWAKAQKDAVLHLERYTYSQDDADYQAFKQTIRVNLGDKQARLALLDTPPRKTDAAKGFLQGQNHLDDVESMIWFFLNFQRISYLRDAIAIWTAADAEIEELISVADEIHQEIQMRGYRPQQIEAYRERLKGLSNELLELENQFSLVLGEGARWVKATIWLGSLALLLLFIGIGIFVSRQIISGIAQAEHKLIASKSRFRSLKESNTIGIVSWRMDGSIDEANDAFLNTLGYDRVDIQAGHINWRALTPAEYHDKDRQAVEELLNAGRCTPYEKALRHKQGHLVPIYVGASLLHGDRQQGVAFVMDLSERRRSEEQARLAATVFAESTDGLMITDAHMRVISVNRALCNMTGYTERELIGQTPKILQSGLTTREQYRTMWDTINSDGHWQGEIIDRKKDGGLLPLSASICGVKNGAGAIMHYVATMTDISERKAAEESLRKIAQHDYLTGLPNRILFNDRIEQALKQAERNQTRFAVLFFDLDDFKPVNDQYGHVVGDKVLQVVASRLSVNVRGTDTVSRLGGDEFVILLHEVADRAMAEKLLAKTVDALHVPCQIDGHEIRVGVSVGLSLFPEDGSDAESLLHHADHAMYAMKNSGS